LVIVKSNFWAFEYPNFCLGYAETKEKAAHPDKGFLLNATIHFVLSSSWAEKKSRLVTTVVTSES